MHLLPFVLFGEIVFTVTSGSLVVGCCIVTTSYEPLGIPPKKVHVDQNLRLVTPISKLVGQELSEKKEDHHRPMRSIIL